MPPFLKPVRPTKPLPSPLGSPGSAWSPPHWAATRPVRASQPPATPPGCPEWLPAQAIMGSRCQGGATLGLRSLRWLPVPTPMGFPAPGNPVEGGITAPPWALPPTPGPAPSAHSQATRVGPLSDGTCTPQQLSTAVYAGVRAPGAPAHTAPPTGLWLGLHLPPPRPFWPDDPALASPGPSLPQPVHFTGRPQPDEEER